MGFANNVIPGWMANDPDFIRRYEESFAGITAIPRGTPEPQFSDLARFDESEADIIDPEHAHIRGWPKPLREYTAKELGLA